MALNRRDSVALTLNELGDFGGSRLVARVRRQPRQYYDVSCAVEISSFATLCTARILSPVHSLERIWNEYWPRLLSRENSGELAEPSLDWGELSGLRCREVRLLLRCSDAGPEYYDWQQLLCRTWC